MGGCSEIELLISCVRPSIDASTTAHIGACLESGVDWTFLIKTSLEHEVIPAHYKGLLKAAPTYIPEDIDRAFQLFCKNIRNRNLYLSQQLATIANACKKQGIPILSFKGPSIAIQAYDDISGRVFQDLDFLIHKNEYAAALNVLQELGYAYEAWKTPTKAMLSWDYYGQDILINEENQVAIEPHWRFAPRPFAINIDIEGLWERASVVSLNRHTLPTLAPEDHLLVLCVHGCKEQWRLLKQVCDIAVLIHHHPSLDWQGLCDRAEQGDCLRILLIGVSLAHDLLNTPVPSMIEHALLKDETALSLAAQAKHRLRHGGRSIPDIYKVNTFRLRMHKRLVNKCQYVFGTWLMPSDRHFRMVTFPLKLRWLYIPLKLFHDYVLLPLWLIHKRVRQIS